MARPSSTSGCSSGCSSWRRFSATAPTSYIGRTFGQRILDSGKFSRVIKPKYIDQTNAFFVKHGGKTISLARFFPFIRTFAPFMAGIGCMDWKRFTVFNVTGGAAWVGLFVGAGYFFGNIPIVQENLEYLVIGIILVSVAPSVIHALWSRFKKPAAPARAVRELVREPTSPSRSGHAARASPSVAERVRDGCERGGVYWRLAR